MDDEANLEDEWDGALVVDQQRHVYLAGGAFARDFPVTGGAFEEIYRSAGDAFASEFDLSGLIDPDAPLARSSHSESGIDKIIPCFLATAVYGTPAADEVHALCRFRDTYLMTNRAGCALVRAYYRLSPPVARFIASRPLAKTLVRGALAPVVLVASAAMDFPVAFSVALVFAAALFGTLLALRVYRVRCRVSKRTI
jgi:hypothetical protein